MTPQRLVGCCVLFVVLLSYGYAKPNLCSSLTAPNWLSAYSVQGILYIPYAEIEEPFSAWYDSPSKQSRIDYYGDMVQTLQLGGRSAYGISVKIVPVTTEQSQNVKTCLLVNGSSESLIRPQSVLPDLTNFTCGGAEIVNDQSTEKWILNENINGKLNKYQMWMKFVDDPTNSSPAKVAVPVKYSMHGYNTLLGSHYDHYYIDYFRFGDSVPDTVFNLSENMTCSGFPGPGMSARHISTFNPMAEFIRPRVTDHVDLEFDKFRNKHNKKYDNTTEHEFRKQLFMNNLRFINSFNRRNRNYSLAVNHLSDKTDAELKALRGKQYTEGYNGGDPFPYSEQQIKSSNIPPAWDWRLYGAVSPVKDQSVCGSCWSFGTIGAIEGAYFLKTGNLVRLSEQALVDCSWGFGNNGCDGGEDFRAYQWMLIHGGVPTEEEYGTYLGQDGECHINEVKPWAPITGYVNVTSNRPDALKLAIVNHGPISVAIDASHKSFSFYSHGVYDEPVCGNKIDQLDHAVLAVGYGKIKDQEYWLVKNSWSNFWGDNGYVLMAIKDNNCGVMTTPTYVTMNKKHNM